ncbi:PcfJ domain-containing protein [Salmonella enterica]
MIKGEMQSIPATVTDYIDIYKMCKERGIGRFVTVDECDKTLILDLCNSFRIIYNKNNRSYLFRRLKQIDKNNNKWVPLQARVRDSIISKLSIYYNRGQNSDKILFEFILRKSIDFLLADLIKAGVQITGSCNTELIYIYDDDDAYDETTERKTERVRVNSEDRKYFGYVKGTQKVSFFSVGEKREIIFDDETRSCGKIDDLIFLKFCGGIYFSSSWRQAGMLLGQQIRKTLDNNITHAMLRINHKKMYSEFTLHDYIQFSKKWDFSGQCDSLYPLLKIVDSLRSDKDKICCDGTNDFFIEKLKCCGVDFSRSEIKALRKAAPGCVGIIADAINYRMRGDASMSGLEAEDREKVRIATKLLRDKTVTLNYPAKVIKKVIETLWFDDVGVFEAAAHERLLNLWLSHYSGVWKQHGYKNHINEWNRYIAQLEHVFDWIRVGEGIVHKNQDWTSIWRNVLQWNPKADKNISSARWEAMNIPQSLLNYESVEIAELVDAPALYVEGQEMHHCVYGYWKACYEGRYRVFTVNSENERATLGVIRDGKKLKFQQMYSYANNPVSAELSKSVKLMLSRINKFSISPA